jgi:hypothetical protein
MRSLFFGTENDIQNGIKPVESSRLYHYVRCGLLTNPDIRLFTSLKEVWDDCAIQSDSGDSLRNYLLIVRRNTVIVPGRVQNEPRTGYLIDQFSSVKGIFFAPGGLTSEGCLVLGWFATNSVDRDSIELFRYISRTVQKRFTRVGKYWFGPEALQMARSGRRLVSMEGRGSTATVNADVSLTVYGNPCPDERGMSDAGAEPLQPVNLTGPHCASAR